MKRSIPPPKGNTGPKRKFTQQQLDDAESLAGKYGARTKELALYFDVCEASIEYWIKNYPDFERAVKRGRVACGMQVAEALVAKAKGYNHEDTQFFPNRIKIRHVDENGKTIAIEERTEIIQVSTIKHYPPDAYAAHKYLSLMFREVWSESININHNHSGTINHRKIEDLPLEELSKQEQDFIFQLNMKQLNDVGSN